MISMLLFVPHWRSDIEPTGTIGPRSQRHYDQIEQRVRRKVRTSSQAYTSSNLGLFIAA